MYCSNIFCSFSNLSLSLDRGKEAEDAEVISIFKENNEKSATT